MEFLNDEFFMKEAIKEAQKALEKDEVPIGAIIVHNNQIIARAHNLTETLNDVTAHAEIQAITAASNALGGKYLKDCTIYITLEPCPMCAGALYWSQISKIVYASQDYKMGTFTKGHNLIHPKTIVKKGILEEQSIELLQKFFKTKRNKFSINNN
jgi:tRNA(adenine34) deaminase